jgi:hypothetical protein
MMEIQDTRWVLMEEGKPYMLFLTQRQAKQEQVKYSLLFPHLDYTIFYDEYYEFSEYN